MTLLSITIYDLYKIPHFDKLKNIIKNKIEKIISL